MCFEGIQTGLGLNWFKVDNFIRPDWTRSCPNKAKKPDWTRPCNITYNAWILSKNHETGFVRLVRHLGEDVGESISANDIILLYLDMFLIT